MRILAVCAANECRSPVIEALLRAAVDGAAADAGFTFTSAGAFFEESHPACALAVDYLRGRSLVLDASARSRPATAVELTASDLVLATDRRVRQELVGIAPGARDRIFLLSQAARAAQSLLGADLVQAARAAAAAGRTAAVTTVDGVETVLVTALSADPAQWGPWLRAEVEAHTAGATVTARRRDADTPDVVDAHRLGTRERLFGLSARRAGSLHEATFATLATQVEPLARLLQALARG